MAIRKKQKRRKVAITECPKCGGEAVATIRYPEDLYNCIRNTKAGILNYLAHKVGKSRMTRILEKYKVEPWAAYKKVVSVVVVVSKVERQGNFKCSSCGHKFKRIIKMNGRKALKLKIKRLVKVFEALLASLPSKDQVCYFCGESLKGTKLCDVKGTNLITFHHVDGNHSNNKPKNLALAHVKCHKSFNLKLRRALEVPLALLKRQEKRFAKGIVSVLKAKSVNNNKVAEITVKYRGSKIPVAVHKKKYSIVPTNNNNNNYIISIPLKVKCDNNKLLTTVVKQIFED